MWSVCRPVRRSVAGWAPLLLRSTEQFAEHGVGPLCAEPGHQHAPLVWGHGIHDCPQPLPVLWGVEARAGWGGGPGNLVLGAGIGRNGTGQGELALTRSLTSATVANGARQTETSWANSR